FKFCFILLILFSKPIITSGLRSRPNKELSLNTKVGTILVPVSPRKSASFPGYFDRSWSIYDIRCLFRKAFPAWQSEHVGLVYSSSCTCFIESPAFLYTKPCNH